jgi:hypothetical protein
VIRGRVARCQIFIPKVPTLVYFRELLNGKFWYILWPFGDFVVNWYILWPFGDFVVNWYIFPHFVNQCPEKSGNPDSWSRRNLTLARNYFSVSLQRQIQIFYI